MIGRVILFFLEEKLLPGVARKFLHSLIVLGAGHAQFKIWPLISWPYHKLRRKYKILWTYVRILNSGKIAVPIAVLHVNWYSYNCNWSVKIFSPHPVHVWKLNWPDKPRFIEIYSLFCLPGIFRCVYFPLRIGPNVKNLIKEAIYRV